MALLIAYVALALGVSFLCSVLEAVLLSVSPSYIAAQEKKGTATGDRLRKLKSDIDRPLAAILSLNTVAHTIGAAGAGAQALEVFGNAYVSAFSVVLTLLILIFSEIIPKTIGARYWKGLSPTVARLLPFLMLITYPLVLLSQGLGKLFAQKKEGPTLDREEFSALAHLMAQEGMIDEKESSVLTNLLKFRQLTAQDIMTPRTVMVAFDQSTTVGEAAQDEQKIRFSRFPVFDGVIDEITGYVLKHDITMELARGAESTPLSELKRDILQTSASARVPALLDTILKRKEHLALLQGDYGETIGLVTLEDIVETLIGMEIVDETDMVVDMQALARKRWANRARQQGLPVSADE